MEAGIFERGEPNAYPGKGRSPLGDPSDLEQASVIRGQACCILEYKQPVDSIAFASKKSIESLSRDWSVAIVQSAAEGGWSARVAA